MPDQQQPTGFDLSQMIGSVSKVKLPGGVVGKVCTVLIFIAIAMAAMAWAAHMVWVSILGIVLLFILAFFILRRLIAFAEKHPHAALFEGAEFLAHEQMQIAMKSGPVLTGLPPSPPLGKQIPPINPESGITPDSPTNG